MQMSDGLTFVINPEAESASVGLLLKSVENIDRLLRHVDYAVHGPRHQHQWTVRELRSSAPTITVEETPLNAVRSVEVIGEGLRAVTLGTDQPPQYFTYQVLETLTKMRGLFGGKSRARSIDVFMNGQQAATIERDISEKANRILLAGHHSIGSLQGTLDAINIHNVPVVTIWDRVFRTPVRCFIPKEDEWLTRVSSLLGNRVTVMGHISYFVNGKPKSIRDVVKIEDAAPDPSLPRAEAGSIPDERAARDPVAFLRSIRGYD